MAMKRWETQVENRWNTEVLFPSLEAWRSSFEKARACQASKWPEIQRFKGHLHEGKETIKALLTAYFDADRTLGNLYTFAHLKHDEEITDPKNKAAYIEALSLLTEFREATAWIEPELLLLKESDTKALLQSDELKAYRFYLEKIFRLKPHTLSHDEEKLLAMGGKVFLSSYKAFSALNDADLKFGEATDASGKKHEITHGRYALYLRSSDRTLRESAFKTYHRKFKSYENTLAELLSGQVETHVFNARARKFSSSLEAALFPKDVSPLVYQALITTVHEEIDALHRYLDLRKQVLGVDTLHMYDLQVPLTPEFDMKIPYEEAESLVIESVAPLGEEYQSILKKGLKTDRWVDRFENENKRSGAYSSGCYDSMPYILMNYKEIVRDLFTLAHEAGHSMHSYYSRKNQPYHDSDYTIFVAEVASTFNEELLTNMLLARAKTDEEKIFLITQKLEDIRGTLFRQTQFAEFEQKIHHLAENNIPLTPETLSGEYLKLNRFYYGDVSAKDEEIAIEWARIPHFYYNFYVYQYATGISAALSLADGVLSGSKEKREAYLCFLKAGGSLFPIDALKKAGVDMRTGEPVKQAIRRFRKLLTELETLLGKKPNLAVR